jgi:hypothetical protein
MGCAVTNLDLPDYRDLAERRGADGFYVTSSELDAVMSRLIGEAG